MNEDTLDYAKPGPSAWMRFWDWATRWPLMLGALATSACWLATGFLFASIIAMTPAFLGLLLSFPTLILWIVRIIRRKANVGRRVGRPWVIAVIVLSGMAGGFVLNAWEIRLKLSLPAMNSMAAKMLHAPPGSPSPANGRCGFIMAYDVQTIDGGIVFGSDYGSPFDWCGYAYHPGGPPPRPMEGPPPAFYFGRNVGGDWYEVSK